MSNLFIQTHMVSPYKLIETLMVYEARGLLRSQKHPTLPLRVWNYTEETQFSKKWDDLTLYARGLITTNDGDVVATPFRKFFNIEEKQYRETSDFEVYSKLDGSLIIVFWYEGQQVVASRGSFTSTQALMATELVKDIKFHQDYENYTFCFELIGPDNLVVCRYPKNELVLTGIFRTNEYEVAYDAFSRYVSKCRCAYRHDFRDYSTIQSLNTQNEEGFVVKFSNGDRCKIKFADYVRLHKICTNLSTTSIWEWVSKGKDMSVLKDIPDEFYNLIKDYADSVKWLFNEKEKEAKEIFAAIKTPNRRKFAEQALTTGSLSRILFLMYDGKDYKETLWNMIKPEYRKL